VQLLLANESKMISSTTQMLNTRNADILQLNSATSQAQINRLNKMLSKLNNQILALTTGLQVLSTQSYTYAKELTPANPSLVSQALASLKAVQALSVQSGLGIGPATPSQ
jgi:hypothetical protein